MVIAYHVIMSAYGFWLPNDPRGSWSDTIRKFELLSFGPPTKVRNNEFVAHAPHNRRLREAAKEVLDFPTVTFTDEQRGVIGKGFAQFVEKSGVTFWAVSILDDHIHAIYMRHRYKSEMVNNLLKGELTKSLVDWDVHPFRSHVRPGERPPPCWGRKWWTVTSMIWINCSRRFRTSRRSSQGWSPQAEVGLRGALPTHPGGVEGQESADSRLAFVPTARTRGKKCRLSFSVRADGTNAKRGGKQCRTSTLVWRSCRRHER